VGTGFGHYIPLVAYLGFGVMAVVSLTGRPLLGFYYMLPFLPYRTMRDHFVGYPLGSEALTILVLAVIVGGLLHGKRLPKSRLYLIWLIFGIYLYFSMWIGTVLSDAPAPIWLGDINFVTWKDYMVIPLVFVAAGLVIDDRKAVRTTVLITAITLLFIDRSCIMESASRTWTTFDENKRDSGPLAYGANQTAAFLSEFAMFFWGFTQYVRQKKFKILGYLLVAVTLYATMYTFSRAGYLSVLFGILVLGVLKNRKLLLLLGVFLLTWQTIVPTAVQQRVTMTENSSGQLEASAQERVDLWTNAEKAFAKSPIVGDGFATFQLGQHVDNLADTHNWYVKVAVETGLIGLAIIVLLLQQMLAVSYRLFKKASDPLYRGLGLGVLLATCACLIANFFGDRWTYLEITGLLWALIATAIRANEFSAAETAPESARLPADAVQNPYLAYR
jgi:putative inorganic carbon (HCO3(-)) transporter